MRDVIVTNERCEPRGAMIWREIQALGMEEIEEYWEQINEKMEIKGTNILFVAQRVSEAHLLSLNGTPLFQRDILFSRLGHTSSKN